MARRRVAIGYDRRMANIAPRALLADLFHTAVAAADPMVAVPGFLPDVPKGRTVVVGAGKASARMALAFEQAWKGELSGVVVTGYGHGEPCERIRVLEAAHPVPDEAGLRASNALLAAVGGLERDDLVVALISGGGSALLPAPPPGLTLADEQALNGQLLKSGLAIGEMNLLRRQLSLIKGGGLARAVGPARLVTLVISDVPGDDPAHVASGPTIPGLGTAAEALALAERAGLPLTPAILAHLRTAILPGTVGRCRQDDVVHVLASAALSLNAAARRCREHYGLECEILSDAVEGEARHVGAEHARLARERQARLSSEGRPILLLSGGETTVTVAQDAGWGGRNTEFAMALGLGLTGSTNIHALAADTDGLDGASGGAGAYVDSGTVARLANGGVDGEGALAAHDTGSSFARIGDLFVTGPTRTNVNDFRAIWVGPAAATGSSARLGRKAGSAPSLHPDTSALEVP
ncbi:hydroxypyruvate reductase [Novosphingobium chloroacetimidivorans]|uniref:Hydroxypyruvate reductase n=1 Tax=Novosphingobium chloroacetimidivorans TaxID=1428314 RepID=A0A7W7NXL3_9SPHN|nr:glycerate kinase [Novosphingobium chloroacetimidivorans]MBB4860481.1 hydroxypyruvate reductase [Novosphingobium chloroacetimidivorans]